MFIETQVACIISIVYPYFKSCFISFLDRVLMLPSNAERGERSEPSEASTGRHLHAQTKQTINRSINQLSIIINLDQSSSIIINQHQSSSPSSSSSSSLSASLSLQGHHPASSIILFIETQVARIISIVYPYLRASSRISHHNVLAPNNTN